MWMLKSCSAICSALAFAILPALSTDPAPAQAQTGADDQWCRDYRNGDRDRESHCEVREMTMPAPRVRTW